MPYSDEKITFPELFSKISSKSIVFAGKIPENIKKLAEEKGIRLFDYFEREEMIVLNTIATAEGAVEIAMNELPITIHSAKILVTGFGRVSKTLCTVLKALNANLFVAARKKSDIAWIKTLGYTPLSFDKAKEIAGSFEIVFNTVPEKVLDGAFLSVLKPDTLVIDLASKPGGVDMEKAAEYNVKTIWALSLPGKVAPVTSGEIIKETVLNMIEELG